MLDDTIAALATAPGDSGVSLLRVSGPNALAVVGRVFRRADGKPLAEAEARRVYYGWLLDRPGGKRIDECLSWFMPGPRSFTGENVVEVSCHGGRVASRMALEALLAAGARLAEAGEFTRRAFLNGRMDLAQAEATIDLIRARTGDAFRAARRRMEGELSRRVRAVSERLLGLLAEIEVRSDFPELELDELDADLVSTELDACADELEALLAGARRGRLLREGLRVVLVGRPNVGKSSLLNALLGAERVIVSEVPGTTRDTVEESLDVDGVPAVLVDTAGIRETADALELAGAERARAAVESADLTLLVIDAGEGWVDEDRAAAETSGLVPMILVVNKSDVRRWKPAGRELPAGVRAVVGVSARTGEGLNELRAAMAAAAGAAESRRGEDALVATVRQQDSVTRALKAVEAARDGVARGMAFDLISVDLNGARAALGEITGEEAPEAVLDQIFSRFCIGK